MTTDTNAALRALIEWTRDVAQHGDDCPLWAHNGTEDDCLCGLKEARENAAALAQADAAPVAGGPHVRFTSLGHPVPCDASHPNAMPVLSGRPAAPVQPRTPETPEELDQMRASAAPGSPGGVAAWMCPGDKSVISAEDRELSEGWRTHYTVPLYFRPAAPVKPAVEGWLRAEMLALADRIATERNWTGSVVDELRRLAALAAPVRDQQAKPEGVEAVAPDKLRETLEFVEEQIDMGPLPDENEGEPSNWVRQFMRLRRLVLAALATRPEPAKPEGVNFRGEGFAAAYAQVVNALRASEGWVTAYAEAYVDDLLTLATRPEPVRGGDGEVLQKAQQLAEAARAATAEVYHDGASSRAACDALIAALTAFDAALAAREAK